MYTFNREGANTYKGIRNGRFMVFRNRRYRCLSCQYSSESAAVLMILTSLALVVVGIVWLRFTLDNLRG